jgi:thiopurine S-methyltransferase
VAEDWLARWQQGRTGWHEIGGNSGLRRFWPELPARSRVLVPLCGKTPDLCWLEGRNLDVTGIELSPLAAEAFFSENGIAHSVFRKDGFRVYAGSDRKISIWCGDYFRFAGQAFDAVYDRGALVALPADMRAAFARHTDSLLRPDAGRLLITLEYDQAIADGPPFSVTADEVRHYWPMLRRVSEKDDLENCPPKFRQAGLKEIAEVVWLVAGAGPALAKLPAKVR